MNNPVITLILPFRERICLLDNMLKSLRETTRDKKFVEIIMAVDDNDDVFKANRERILEENKIFQIIIYETKRSHHFINDYWNAIAKKARGRWVMAINDDSVFKTKDWDYLVNKRMRQRAEKYGDDIIYGKVDDCCNLGGRNSKDCYFSCWCLQGREVIDALGFFYEPNIWVWGPDQVCGLIFLALKNITKQERIVDIYDVVIDHDSYHGGKGTPEGDPNWHYMSKIETDHHYETTREREAELAMILKRYIDRKRGKK